MTNSRPLRFRISLSATSQVWEELDRLELDILQNKLSWSKTLQLSQALVSGPSCSRTSQVLFLLRFWRILSILKTLVWLLHTSTSLNKQTPSDTSKPCKSSSIKRWAQRQVWEQTMMLTVLAISHH